MKLTLRGHHLLCLQGFQGYGYDNNFIKNMTYINDLRKNEDTIISVINNPDDICKHCPNLQNGICQTEKQNQEIINMDNEVLSKIDTTKKYESRKLFNEIANTFHTKESVKYICATCNWHEECLFYKDLE